jgi:hypothetical protein
MVSKFTPADELRVGDVLLPGLEVVLKINADAGGIDLSVLPPPVLPRPVVWRVPTKHPFSVQPPEEEPAVDKLGARK